MFRELACPQLLLLWSRTLHFCVLLLLYPLYTVADVTSSSILSVTLAAPPSPMTSFAAIPMTVATCVSPGRAASSRLASPSNQLPIAEMSSIHYNSSTATSSQLSPANGRDSPLGSGPGAVIGAVVAVVIVLVVGSVIVAALLIAWRLRSRGKKDFIGRHSDWQ